MYATYKAAASGKLTTFGFRRGLERDFDLGASLGEGAFGTVRVATEKRTGRRFAAKLLPKRFVGARFLEAHYAARVLHEVDALAAVGNSLNASHLVAAYEDDRQVALVMELCSGGALLSRVQPGKWRERDAARAVLNVVRALAHCHSAGVLVRDVKPDNFLFRDESPQAPLKMIDFGLAVTLPPLVAVAREEQADSAAAPSSSSSPQQKVTDRAGTPHFCAPEVLRMSYSYPADVWSAGVIAYLLLTGRFPWWNDELVRADERELVRAAAEDGKGGGKGGGGSSSSSSSSSGGGAFAMAAGGLLPNKDLFRAILRGQLDFDAPPFGDGGEGGDGGNSASVSAEARDCVRRMLDRDADARPTAAELLRHPWLVRAAAEEQQGGSEEESAAGASAGAADAAPLDASLVQRLQRFGAYGRLRQLALRRVAHLALLEFEEDEADGEQPSSSSSVLARVVAAFRALPRGSDGRVAYADVSASLERHYDLSEAERRMLVLQLDADRDGRVDLDEFSAAMADWGQLAGGSGGGGGGGGEGGGGNTGSGNGSAWGRWLKAVFDTLDSDHSGRISAEELEDALCRVGFDDDDEEEGAATAAAAAADNGNGGLEDPGGGALCDPGAVAAALREADADGDGALSLQEFEALLRGAGGGAPLELFPARLRRRVVAEGGGRRTASASPAPSPPAS